MRLLLFVMLLFFVSSAKAQEDEIKTIFGSGIHKVSGFGSHLMSFGAIDNEFAYYMGGGAAVLLNDNVFIGGYGQALLSSLHRYNETMIKTVSKINLQSGGIWSGYIFKPMKALHLKTGLMAGLGKITFIAIKPSSETKLFDITPFIVCEINVTPFMRVDMGINYKRFFMAETFAGISDNEISSPAMFLAFNFGWFR